MGGENVGGTLIMGRGNGAGREGSSNICFLSGQFARASVRSLLPYCSTTEHGISIKFGMTCMYSHLTKKVGGRGEDHREVVCVLRCRQMHGVDRWSMEEKLKYFQLVHR